MAGINCRIIHVDITLSLISSVLHLFIFNPLTNGLVGGEIWTSEIVHTRSAKQVGLTGLNN